MEIQDFSLTLSEFNSNDFQTYFCRTGSPHHVGLFRIEIMLMFLIYSATFLEENTRKLDISRVKTGIPGRIMLEEG